MVLLKLIKEDSVSETAVRPIQEEKPEPSLEVPIQSVAVYLPEDPIVINGVGHIFKVNSEGLAEAVIRIAQPYYQTGHAQQFTECRN